MVEPRRSDLGYIADVRNGPSDYVFFWRPGGAGYTSDLSQAGLYTREDYESSLGARCAQMAFVPKDVAEALVRPMIRYADLHARGIKNESWRREDFKTEAQAETLRAVFG